MIEDLTKEKLQEYKFQSDLDFIKGSIEFKFIPQGESGYLEIIKDGFKKIYSVYKYFDLDLENWTNTIDNAISKEEKIQIANNAIFKYQSDNLYYKHEVIDNLIDKNIEYLKKSIDYINSSVAPKQSLQDKTFKSKLTVIGLEKLYDELINVYIKPIGKDDFTYYFLDKTITKNKDRIYWIKSKSKAFYLVKEITVNFSIPTMNNCVQSKYLKFDSNDKNKTGYNEIDVIINACK